MIYAILKFILFSVLGLASTILTWVFAPIIALFYFKELRIDTVKRFNKEVKAFDREYIWKYLNWFATHDNAVDEYFWGFYKGDWLDKLLFGKIVSDWSIEEYDSSPIKRWWVRVRWLWRNPAYKFSHDVLGFQCDEKCIESINKYKNFEITTWLNLDGSRAFLVVGGIGFKPFNNLRFGWKPNKGFSKLMFADRIISLRDK